jgi:hypothetical protein
MSDIAHKIDVVAARNDLTDAGIKLLEVVTRPECRTMSITKQCELADISRTTYYALFKDDNFKRAYTELCQTMLLSGAAPASQALNAQAAMGDTAAIKMLLELAGIYQPTATVNVHQTIDAGPSLRELLDSRKADR